MAISRLTPDPPAHEHDNEPTGAGQVTDLENLTIQDHIEMTLGTATAALLANAASARKLPGAEVVELERLGEYKHFPEDSQLIEQGTAAREAYLVVEGALSVEREGELVAHVEPGAFAGELSLISGHGRNADVFACADSSVLAFDEDNFGAMLDACPTLARDLMQSSVHRLSA